jgi:hypothetical protein
MPLVETITAWHLGIAYCFLRRGKHKIASNKNQTIKKISKSNSIRRQLLYIRNARNLTGQTTGLYT